MENELWNCRDQSRRLNETRTLAATLWQDTASRELTVRYLTPHSEEDARMLEEYQAQLASAEAVRLETISVVDSVLQIEVDSLECQELIERCMNDLSSAHQYSEYFAQANVQAQVLFKEVEKLITQAASICEGVPTS